MTKSDHGKGSLAKTHFTTSARLVILSKVDRSIVRDLEQEDIERIGKGIYLVPEGTEELKSKFADRSHFRFRKVREIPAIKSRDPESRKRKVFAVVWYRFSTPTARQKKRVQRLILRAPCIRLRPGVLLFPHLRSKDRERYLKQESATVLGSKEFSQIILSMGANVTRWTRLQLVNQASNELLLESLRQMKSNELESLEKKLRALREAAKQDSKSNRRLQERYSEYSRIYKTLKEKYDVIRLVWNVDTRENLRRIYNLMMRVKHSINSEKHIK